MIDSHCHLNDPLYATGEINQLVSNAQSSGVTTLITNGAGIYSSQRAIAIAEQYPEVYATAGIHPEDAGDIEGMAPEQMEKTFLEMTRHPKVVAFGECGLDYTDQTTDQQKQDQLELLRINVYLANKADLPLVVHCRNAFADIFSTIDYPRVQMHCFTGNLEQMQECVSRGWYVSFGGILTFKNSVRLREVACRTSAERLLIETDSPYLSPEPFRGERNQPANVKIVAQCLAQVRSTSIDQIEAVTTANAKRLFTKL